MGKKEGGEKEKWEKREKGCVCVRERERERERERYRIDGGGLSYASGVRPLVRVATVNVHRYS